jgi:hypothetical protein
MYVGISYLYLPGRRSQPSILFNMRLGVSIPVGKLLRIVISIVEQV